VDERGATRILFERYLDLIEREPCEESRGNRLSLGNLAWMCREAIAGSESLPVDKLSRWLGFVQGCLAMRGLVDVDAERSFSRPLFHEAYRTTGRAVPPILENNPEN